MACPITSAISPTYLISNGRKYTPHNPTTAIIISAPKPINQCSNIAATIASYLFAFNSCIALIPLALVNSPLSAATAASLLVYSQWKYYNFFTMDRYLSRWKASTVVIINRHTRVFCQRMDNLSQLTVLNLLVMINSDFYS